MNPFKTLAAEFERLGIPYLLGGSHASSVRGVGRPTMDTDLVAAIHPSKASGLASGLGREWYADPEQMREAISLGRAFNLIHIPTAEKFDIFPATDEFQLGQLQRATRELLPFSGEVLECPVATSEDILLAKLNWYKMGGETSERQWADIEGIVRVNATLDLAYLDTWAARLGVTQLLERALRSEE